VADTEVTPRQCKGGGNVIGNEVFYGFFFGKVKKMRKNKGFTLIELMVVILIVAILAAVLAPLMTGRIRAAKWSEGKAGAGTIATAIRAYSAEHEGLLTAIGTLSGAGGFVNVGIMDADLNGKYFTVANYSATNVSATANGSIYYRIQITPGTGCGTTNKYLISTASSVSQWIE